jgi:hypothetical protein
MPEVRTAPAAANHDPDAMIDMTVAIQHRKVLGGLIHEYRRTA